MHIKEIDLAKSGIEYHKTLNPQVWDISNQTLNPLIRTGLLRIARKFVESLNVRGLDIQDIMLTGSMANYNWTKYSDFDLHLVTDYTKLEGDLAEELFKAKKNLWNTEHDITIKEHDVELYVEDTNKPPNSQGLYSLLDDKWIKKPVFAEPKYDDSSVDVKASGLMTDIDRLLQTQPSDPDEYTRLTDKIWKMRQAGLDEAGEFSTENLAFKILRNLGYLDKLIKAKTNTLDRNLSIP